MSAKVRSHVRSNIVGYIALFIALGGTASAAVIVTDNSEVATNTISGHNPPAGDHANIIGGSIDSSDLASASVTGHKIAGGAVSTPKFAPNATAPDANQLGGVPAPEYVRAFGLNKRGLLSQDSAATVEIGTSERVSVIDYPPTGASFLAGAFQITCNDTDGTKLYYKNRSADSESVFLETGAGFGANRIDVPSSGEVAIDHVVASGGGEAEHHVEASVVGAGIGDGRYDIYLEHDDSANPSFSDLCLGFGFLSTAWQP